MSSNKVNSIRLGIFALAALVLFAVGIYNIGDKQNLFNSTFRVSTMFSNVKGLQDGNNVRFAGINVGVVKDMVVIDDTTIRVDMRLEKSALEYLRKDAIAAIGSDGLVGNMIVNINPGSGSAELIQSGDFIQSFTSIETDEMLNALGSTTDNIALLSAYLLEVIEKINEGQGSIAMLLNNKSVADDLISATSKLHEASQNINQMSVGLRNDFGEIGSGNGLMSYLLNDSTFQKDLQNITAGIDSLVRQETVPIMYDLSSAAKSMAVTTASLQELVGDINLQDGIAGVILNDTLVANDFRNSMVNLNEVAEKLNVNMEAMRHNFLFRGYFRKLEKAEKRQLKKEQRSAKK